jgi:hypothetical protein
MFSVSIRNYLLFNILSRLLGAKGALRKESKCSLFKTLPILFRDSEVSEQVVEVCFVYYDIKTKRVLRTL